MFEQKYAIKPLTSTKDRDYVDAIKIYIESIPADVRTSTNEIATFVNAPEDSYRRMYFFALQHQGLVIGYAQFAYLKHEKILFLDYIAFETQYKVNSAFYPFMSIISMYFLDVGIEYNYYITELGLQNSGKSIDIDSLFLRKVLSVEDFLAIAAPYRQPELGINRQETRVDAQLYIKTSSSIQSLQTETYFRIVHTIYFQHYLSWYKKVLNDAEIEQYETELRQEYERIVTQLSEKKEVDLLDSVASRCKYYSGRCQATHENTSAPLPQPKKQRKWPYSLLVLMLTAFISLIFYYLLKYLEITVNEFAGVYAATTALAVGVTAYYFKEKS